MAESLIGGAVLGAVVGELLKAVLDAKQKAAAFRPSLARLESTLTAIIPRLDQINSLSIKLDIKEPGMKELVALIIDGKALVLKCSKISSINWVRKVQYSKELLDLDNSLLRYFMTILPLDHFKVTNEILAKVNELHMKLVDNTAPPTTASCSSGSSKEERVPKGSVNKDGKIASRSETASKMKLDMKLADNKDGIEIASQSETAASKWEEKMMFKKIKKPKEKYKEEEEDLYPDMKLVGNAASPTSSLTDSTKESAVKLHKDSKKQEISEQENQKDSEENVFMLEWCPYKFRVADLLGSNAEVLGKGPYGTNYSCRTEYGVVRMYRLREVKAGRREFNQRIKDLGKFGQHPNVSPPLGFYFSASEKFLIYDHFPTGSLSTLLHDHRFGNWTQLDDWISTVNISLGIARGISHLHSEGGVNFIHGNIKSSSVLLKPDLDGCISDYGLDPLVNFPATIPQEEGYHGPEVSSSERGGVCQESDVYSFGVVLLEILTQRPAYTNLPSWIHSVDREKWVTKVSDRVLRYNGHHEEQMLRMMEIAMMCVDPKPVRRPKMRDVVRMIEKLPPSPFFLGDTIPLGSY